MKRRASQQKGIKLQIYKVGSYKWNFLWERQKSLTGKGGPPERLSETEAMLCIQQKTAKAEKLLQICRKKTRRTVGLLTDHCLNKHLHTLK